MTITDMRKLFTFLTLAALLCCTACKESPKTCLVSESRGQDAFRLGIAGFTYKNFTPEEGLAMAEAAGVHYMSIKNYWLPYASTDEEMAQMKALCSAHGIEPYILGPIYMKTKESVDNAFDYVQRFGHDMFVGVPTYELLDYTIQKVQETGIKVAIHTHGPSDNPFPVIQSVVERVKDPSLGVGCCLDLGHSVRYGNNVVEDILKYKDWIYDVHIKDESEASEAGDTVEMGRGVMDFKPILNALKEISYTGVIALEYEKDMNAPQNGITESLGYLRGILDAIN